MRGPAATLTGRAPVLAGLALSVTLTACGPVGTAGPGCRPVRTGVVLPEGVPESSGAAVSLRYPGIVWTHNDSGRWLHAVDLDGALVARIGLPLRLRDWEDLAVAACGPGESCLYAADLGDNYEERHDLRIVRFSEPDPRKIPPGPVDSVDVFPVRLPDGPRDIEAMVVLPGERIFAVTKGRNDPLTVYRYPPPLRPDTVTLEEVQRLSEGPRILPRQITGGGADRSGLVALRTYESLRFYRMQDDTLVALDGVVNLRVLQESQGEGVALGLDGEVVVTSEGGPGGGPASLNRLRCDVPGT